MLFYKDELFEIDILNTFNFFYNSFFKKKKLNEKHNSGLQKFLNCYHTSIILWI